MGYTIAITGKGGCGKTTIAGLIVDALVRLGKTPVLAVDADPNSCLDTVLGVRVEKSIGTIREEAREEAAKGMASGIAKRDLLELRISECLVEADGFDLIAMGRPEGPGCYCYANNVLRDVIAGVSASYPYVVIDNEAGLENLSRRIVASVDLLILVAEPSINGVKTVQRLHELAGEMGIGYTSLAIIVNRMKGDSLIENARLMIDGIGAHHVMLLRDDDEIAAASERGSSITGLSTENNVSSQIYAFIQRVLSN
ncbi:MAG TPA: AAA family ATPase [Spirochaetota bacterium]|mgnify:CR=1 FL=1|nr:AAA family ATPase [Spirochaetota bacterium]HNT09923.1 AAA family ATPase [Spirochaetota bacterium]HNV45868.1 AAA family ATPase [Spirochaetota bacterium]HOS38562.1 AAA family ATPase [Spirochaetota bacterium]HPI21764.1 AAA family ATPase [Spirochaetota bacterium]